MTTKLVRFARAWDRCSACQLRSEIRSTWRGRFGARVAFIGEAPELTDGESGQPFSGATGQVLDDLISEAGHDPSEAFFVHSVACRPSGERTPRLGEMRECEPRLGYLLERCSPRIVVLLGWSVAMHATGRGSPELRGKIVTAKICGREYRAIATWNPRLLRSCISKSHREELIADIKAAFAYEEE